MPQSPGDTGGSDCCPANPGITGTPVIDLNTNTMYLGARTKENGKQIQRLQALDITTGTIKNSTVINPSVSGTGRQEFPEYTRYQRHEYSLQQCHREPASWPVAVEWNRVCDVWSA